MTRIAHCVLVLQHVLHSLQQVFHSDQHAIHTLKEQRVNTAKGGQHTKEYLAFALVPLLEHSGGLGERTA